ncbi:nucleotidyltransferase domain-containing protein [Paenibacillus tarimensis]|uniref:nucleotidyltransferase domain-containing protein n=1 Tax=Paenibacillus tarimensis TaxID=416012 RepID=UPI001F23271A|nr:nucleotidyltransferase family protein [Paenibacillus tarimensis]MCF2944251.1 nucleotidyltransferase family protein [Paenibacillus tarimensis]
MNTDPVLNRSSLSPELSLLLLLSAAEDHEDSAAAIAAASENRHMDWRLFLRLAEHHRTYPSVYLQLKRAAAHNNPAIPQELMQALHALYTRNTFQMLHLSAEMTKVCGRMSSQGIRMLVLKGPALAKHLYGDISLRTSKDLDVLVAPADVTAAAQQLVQMGYTTDYACHELFHLWKRKTHHISYYHPVHRTMVEVHWQLDPHKGSEPSFESIWDRRRTMLFSGTPVHTPGDQELLLYLAIHGARHGWFRLRWLADVDRLLRSSLVLHERLPAGCDYAYQAIVGQAMLLSAGLFGTPLSKDDEDLYANDRAHRLARTALPFILSGKRCPDESNKQAVREFRHYLLAQMSVRQRLDYYTKPLFPSSRDAVQLPMPRPLHFLYFPLRPLLWLWRHFRRQPLTRG